MDGSQIFVRDFVGPEVMEEITKMGDTESIYLIHEKKNQRQRTKNFQNHLQQVCYVVNIAHE